MFSFVDGGALGLGLCSCLFFFHLVLWWEGAPRPPHWHSGPAESDLWLSQGGLSVWIGGIDLSPSPPDFSLRSSFIHFLMRVPSLSYKQKCRSNCDTATPHLCCLVHPWVVDPFLPAPLEIHDITHYTEGNIASPPSLKSWGGEKGWDFSIPVYTR